VFGRANDLGNSGDTLTNSLRDRLRVNSPVLCPRNSPLQFALAALRAVLQQAATARDHQRPKEPATVLAQDGLGQLRAASRHVEHQRRLLPPHLLRLAFEQKSMGIPWTYLSSPPSACQTANLIRMAQQASANTGHRPTKAIDRLQGHDPMGDVTHHVGGSETGQFLAGTAFQELLTRWAKIRIGPEVIDQRVRIDQRRCRIVPQPSPAGTGYVCGTISCRSVVPPLGGRKIVQNPETA
jgi:hypothetical protein